LVAREDGRKRQYADLEGGTVAVNALGNVIDVTLNAALERHGVELVVLPPELIDALPPINRRPDCPCMACRTSIPSPPTRPAPWDGRRPGGCSGVLAQQGHGAGRIGQGRRQRDLGVGQDRRISSSDCVVGSSRRRTG
jgi:hypothetical protein